MCRCSKKIMECEIKILQLVLDQGRSYGNDDCVYFQVNMPNDLFLQVRWVLAVGHTVL